MAEYSRGYEAVIMGDVDVPQHLREKLTKLAPNASRFVAGVSGGADSVALARALAAAGYDVVVAHLDHGLRPESPEDARFVEGLSAELGFQSRLERVEVASVAQERGWNLEDAARRIRYQFLNRCAREAGARAVLTAHTLDDQAETVLMQLLRGAGYLRGIAPARRRLLRPLLDVSREELESYLRQIGQQWRDDLSNDDTRLLRAWLRHDVIPLLRERSPRLPRQLARLAQVQRDVEEYLKERGRGYITGRGFDQTRLVAAHPAVQREAIRWLFEEAEVAPTAAAIEEVRERLGRSSPYRRTLKPGLALRVAYGRLEVVREQGASAEGVPGRRVGKAEDLPAGVPTRVLSYPNLELRNRRPGDRMRLSGGSKSLARILIDRKIPREERDRLDVLASGSRILWAQGVGLAKELSDRESDPEEQVSGDGSLRAWPAVSAVEGGEPGSEVWYMRRALELAQEAAQRGELPVGAVVVLHQSKPGEGGSLEPGQFTHRGTGRVVGESRIVGEGYNETRQRNDPTAHAELLAMRRAGEELGDWRLSDCTLYVTLEPCPMCTGALLESHISRVVYGARNHREGALGSIVDLLSAPWKRRVEVRGGVLAREAANHLSSFFAARRSESS